MEQEITGYKRDNPVENDTYGHPTLARISIISPFQNEVAEVVRHFLRNFPKSSRDFPGRYHLETGRFPGAEHSSLLVSSTALPRS